MPQIQLPIFPDGATDITHELGFMKVDGTITYFNGHMPVFTHAESDLQSFRMITSMFIANGNARIRDIQQAFGLPLSTVKRYLRLYREKGTPGFYAPRRVRGASVLTDEVIENVQSKLDDGYQLKEIAKEVGIKLDTLRKAAVAGRLHVSEKKSPKSAP